MNAFANKRVAVLGDLMLDRYISGRASHISQEAPVPVVAVGDTHDVPGGAANVARNVLALGGQANVYGSVGQDDAGQRLRELLTEMGADQEGVYESRSRKTTEKTRVIANRQQVVRIDTEDTYLATATEIAWVAEPLETAIEAGRIDALIIEDYAKGVLTPELVARVLSCALKHQVPVSMDPHPANLIPGSCIRAMTPNRSEAFQMAGAFEGPSQPDPTQDGALANVAQTLMERWGVRYLLITLGPQGMVLFREGAGPRHIETKAQEVFDVSGAGDTVIGTLTLALATGAPIEDAADLANHAAGIVVGKMGTAIVTRDELLASFQ